MKKSLQSLFVSIFIFSAFTINAKISNDLHKGAVKLLKVPDQLSKIVPSIIEMYSKLQETKVKIQSKAQENNAAKIEIENIKKLLDTNSQMQLLPKTNRDTLKAALDALTKNDGSGALDELSNILNGLKTRIDTINSHSTEQITSLSLQTGIAIRKINHEKLLDFKKQTLPQRMNRASKILDDLGQ